MSQSQPPVNTGQWLVPTTLHTNESTVGADASVEALKLYDMKVLADY